MPKTGILFAFGYFASDYYPFFARHFVVGTIVLCAAGVAGILLVLRKADGMWAGGIDR